MNIFNNLSCIYLNPQLHLKSCLPILSSIGPEKKVFGKLWSTFWKIIYSPEESSRCQLHTHHCRQGSPALVSEPFLWRNHMRVLSWQVLPCLPFLLGHTIKTEPPQPSFPLLIVIKALESNLILLIGKPLEMAILTWVTLPSAQVPTLQTGWCESPARVLDDPRARKAPDTGSSNSSRCQYDEMWWYEIHQSIFTHRYQGQNTEDQILSITSRCLSHKLAPASADQGLWDPWNLRLWEHVRAPKYVVSYPTRWSLLFIFGFLYGSSSEQRNIVQLCTREED